MFAYQEASFMRFCNPRSRRETRRLRPTLEILEDRSCPSATALFNAGTGVLTITGTNSEDNVAVIAKGDGTLFFSGFNNAPTVNTADVIRINLDLRGGEDSAMFDFSGAANLSALTAINVTANSGEDSIFIDSGDNAVNATLGVRIGTGARLDANVNLGSAADTFNVAVNSMATAGSFTLDLNAGAGGDTVGVNFGTVAQNATVDLNVNLDASSSGADSDTFSLTGGVLARNANLILDVTGQGGTDTVNVSLNGLGRGARADVNVDTGA